MRLGWGFDNYNQSTPNNFEICDICKHECISETICELHINKHREVRKFKCLDCGYEADTLDGLIMHENVQHSSLCLTIIESVGQMSENYVVTDI